MVPRVLPSAREKPAMKTAFWQRNVNIFTMLAAILLEHMELFAIKFCLDSVHPQLKVYTWKKLHAEIRVATV